MMNLRKGIPILGFLALLALFLKLPETPDVFGLLGCKTCAGHDPYIPLLGAFYFSTLIVVSLLFPSFPSPQIAKGGIVWAFLLAFVLTYLYLPNWCPVCLFCHGCNILIWTTWAVSPRLAMKEHNSQEKWCLLLFAPISVVALFSGLNLTLMAYNFKASHELKATSLKAGDPLPSFSAHTNEGHLIANDDQKATGPIALNFITPECPYCKEQMQVLNAALPRLTDQPFRFINISPTLPLELIQSLPMTEWIEDKEGKIRKLFDITGYPTLIVAGVDGKIVKIIPGVPAELKSDLMNSINQNK